MTAPTPRPIGLNKRPGSLFGLQSAPPVESDTAPAESPEQSVPVTPQAQPVLPAVSKQAKTKAPRLVAAKALPPVDEDDDFGTVRVGLYLRSSVADRAQTAMSDFGTRHAREIRRRGARRNSLNAFLSAVLDHALENLDSVDPNEIIGRMPRGGR